MAGIAVLQIGMTSGAGERCDSSDGSAPFGQGVREMPGEQVRVQIARRHLLYTFEAMPKRWGASAVLPGLERNRKL